MERNRNLETFIESKSKFLTALHGYPVYIITEDMEAYIKNLIDRDNEVKFVGNVCYTETQEEFILRYGNQYMKDKNYETVADAMGQLTFDFNEAFKTDKTIGAIHTKYLRLLNGRK